MQFLRIGTAGLRGRIGAGLDPAISIGFTSAFGTYLEGGKIVVGRDSRFSSPMLHHSAVSALMSCGCQVLDAGICPAPLLQFLVPHCGAAGGVLIGAGHHPAEWNAIVLIDEKGAYLNSSSTQEFLDVYHGGRYTLNPWNSIGKYEHLSENIQEKYIDSLIELVDRKAVKAGKFKIVADFCNGSGSRAAVLMAKKLGVEMLSINDTFSGVLPHDPEPRPRSAVQVRSMMRYTKAHAGFVFNSDMSRTSIVTDDAETLSEEYTFPLVADHLLSRLGKGCRVITNWCSTRTADEVVARHGGEMIKTKVGQAFVIDKMLETDAKLAGDGSGSVAVVGAPPGFDSYAAMIIILEAMAARKTSSAGLMESLPRYHIIKKKVNCPSAHAYTLIRKMRSHFSNAAITEEDGLRFDWKDGWIHLRAAMTEPIIRMIVEWKTKEGAEEKANEVSTLVERLVAL